MRKSVIVSQCEWARSYSRLWEKAWNCILISCYDTTKGKPQIFSYSLEFLSLPGGPLFLGDPEAEKHESNWLSFAANKSLLYHSSTEIPECTQPIKKRKPRWHWEWSTIKISLCVIKLCRTIQEALSETRSNLSDCILKLILVDEKSLTSFIFSKCHPALDHFHKWLLCSHGGRQQKIWDGQFYPLG